ncbi:hypothetical protein ACFY36_36600 [Actinoplanes sp. NPDC000266]
MWGRGLYAVVLIGLAVALHLGQRWTWRVMVVICTVSALLGALLIGLFGLRAVAQIVGPAVYPFLLTRPSVRAWFAPEPPQLDTA